MRREILKRGEETGFALVLVNKLNSIPRHTIVIGFHRQSTRQISPLTAGKERFSPSSAGALP